ncbi:quinone-dependent L-lactate dehydrogenase [Pseudoclavibacter caeni]|jgi:L-lactate dehydrogenase (cytochrome)
MIEIRSDQEEEPMTQRRIPRWQDLRQFLQVKPIDLDGKRRRLSSVADVWDIRRIARRRTPAVPFDYVDGAAEGEVSLRRARQAWRDVEFHPAVLSPVGDLDVSQTIFDHRVAFPLGICPTGFVRMMNHEGEIAAGQAAADAGVPYNLSTMGTTSLEDLAGATPGGWNWFQLYLWKDRERSVALVERAKAAGYDTIVLTVDCPVAGARLRDVRNGMTIPPRLTPKTFLNGALRPAWVWNFLTTEPLRFASLDSWNGTVAEIANAMFDPTISIEDVEWLREQWDGNLVVKGIQTVTDARRVHDAGADAVWLSNHGGRQLDRAPIPLHLLPRVREALGDDATILIDTGIMNGADVVTAIAQGADMAMIGRAYLYGLMAAGREGVAKVLSVMRAEYTRTLQLLGVARTADLGPQHVRLLRRLSPIPDPRVDDAPNDEGRIPLARTR